ncbi:nucleotidyltransferase substrate binding protein [Fibrella aquatica]|jgi:nucleotidyltransferase substrate binding protein (TIGR01987 family)|uniref:nucleotidyltransferase substrate binding protein n=1 Tax=Fibrella aquatica TaxID=3242487 RepID=UPI0035202CFA
MMDEQLDRRWEQRFVNYRKALAKLREVSGVEGVEHFSELEREGIIQRFEYTYELAWKTLQDYLRYKGYIDIAGPNPVLTQAIQDGYIADADGWRQMKKARELSSHTYDSAIANEVVEAILQFYFNLLDALEKRLLADYSGGQLNLFES